MTLRISRRASAGVWLVAWLMLAGAGCAKHNQASRLSVPCTPSFSVSGDVIVPDRWWESFNNPALNSEIGSSLFGSFTLEAAWQRLRAAQALTRLAASDLCLDLNGIGATEATVRTDGDDQARFELGLDAAYELDLWGRIGSRVEAQRLQASATLEDYHAITLTLSAQVARTWFALMEAHAQLELLGEQIETNRTVLELLESRFSVGQIRLADVLRQQQLVEATREQAVVVRAQIEVLEHFLAVLQGRPPQLATYDTGSQLPELPPLPRTGLPSELLDRRPDVRRDFLALRAADRDLASAISAQYPRLNFTYSLTTVAERPENLFEEWIFTTTSQLIAPLFDAGERRAEVDRNVAVFRQRFAEFGDTVLNAYREVEDALAQEWYQLERIERLRAQLDLARQASARLYDQYIFFREETDFLDVLSATTEEQRLQRAILSARLDLVLNRIALYLALAGDFDGRP